MTNVNCDELAGKAFASNATSEDYEKLFAAVFSLPEWFFIADGELPNIVPYSAVFPDVFGDQSAVAVFTDSNRARRFMAESESRDGMVKSPAVSEPGGIQAKFSSENMILTIPTAGILDYLEKLISNGIVKIFFNPDKNSHGFHHDLKMMRPIWEHLESKGLLSANDSKATEAETASTASNEETVSQPAAEVGLSAAVDFDALSRKANDSSGSMEDMNNLFGAAFALEKWEFIARGEAPNFNPYTASHPTAADNQPMIRAFTDGERLQRFAKENKLTREDGSVDVLTIPTKAIVEYLEQFIEYGAYGVWFNSDAQSDGFFIPIKQLRPIKDHLAKLKGVTTLLVQIKDGLGFPSGFVKASEDTQHIFCRVPSDWIEDEQLKPERLERIYQQLYGANWRTGNSDGSHYKILDSYTKIFDAGTVRNTDFSGTVNQEKHQFRFYLGDSSGAVRKVSSEEFQAEVNSEKQAAETKEARQRQDNLANWGISETVGGDADLNLNINQRGAVNFETGILPFYEAIVPLLANYQGTGEYVTLLAFDSDGISQLAENVTENSHGAYLQIRRFVYLNPKNNVRIGVSSIHSRRLRHIQSRAELLVSFELCKNLDNETAALYYAFQGSKGEVLKLAETIQPLLKNCDYQAV